METKESVLKKCPKKDKKSGKPWCLYDSKSERLLGRHQNKEKAMKQERAIHASAPKGWNGTVEAMKDHPEIDNPWALSYWLSKQKKGDDWGDGGELTKKPKPHYEEKKSFDKEKIIQDVINESL